jgi:hypothetical protein
VVDTVRIKRPLFAVSTEGNSGRITHDDRGNAVWQWADNAASSPELVHSGLSIADDDPSPVGNVKINHLGAKTGYNPYESGLIDKTDRHRKRDLHALSQWIDLKNKRGEGPKG